MKIVQELRDDAMAGKIKVAELRDDAMAGKIKVAELQERYDGICNHREK